MILRSFKLILIIFTVVFLQLFFASIKTNNPSLYITTVNAQSVTNVTAYWFHRYNKYDSSKTQWFVSYRANGYIETTLSGSHIRVTPGASEQEILKAISCDSSEPFLHDFTYQGVRYKDCQIVTSADPPTDTPPPTVNTPPPVDDRPFPPEPPCAQWKDGNPDSGVCEKVATSIFDKDKSSGYISTDPAKFIIKIFTFILASAGGIALLLIIIAGYKIITSKGKPDNIQQGRDQLIAAIVGLIFILFSLVIFQLVFADILKIPGIN